MIRVNVLKKLLRKWRDLCNTTGFNFLSVT